MKIPPPKLLAELPEKVLFVTVSAPWLPMPPPVVDAELVVKVLFVTVSRAAEVDDATAGAVGMRSWR